MTLEQLQEKVDVVRGFGYNCYVVKIIYRGKEYVCQSNNSLAWDRIGDDNYRDDVVNDFYTEKGAYQAFYDECKRKNSLGEYRN